MLSSSAIWFLRASSCSIAASACSASCRRRRRQGREERRSAWGGRFVVSGGSQHGQIHGAASPHACTLTCTKRALLHAPACCAAPRLHPPCPHLLVLAVVCAVLVYFMVLCLDLGTQHFKRLPARPHILQGAGMGDRAGGGGGSSSSRGQQQQGRAAAMPKSSKTRQRVSACTPGVSQPKQPPQPRRLLPPAGGQAHAPRAAQRAATPGGARRRECGCTWRQCFCADG